MVGRNGFEVSLPLVYSALIGGDNLHRTIQTSSRIPSTALFKVIKMHLNIVFSFFNIRCNVESESVIAIHPTSYFFAINLHNRLTHCAIEVYLGVFGAFLYIKCGFIAAFSNPRKTSRASCMLDRTLLSVLNNR